MIDAFLNVFLLISQKMYVISFTFIFLVLSSRRIFGSALCVMLFTAVYNPVLKAIFKMPLPPSCGVDDYGFPSGHIHMFCVFMWNLMAYYTKSWQRATALALVCLASIASVYFGKHYLIDILPCPFLAIVSVFVCHRLMKLFKEDYVKVYCVFMVASVLCAGILYSFDENNITDNTFMYLFLMFGLMSTWKLLPSIELTLMQRLVSLSLLCFVYILTGYLYGFVDDSYLFMKSTRWLLISGSIFPIMRLCYLFFSKKSFIVKKNRIVAVLLLVGATSIENVTAYSDLNEPQEVYVVKSTDEVIPFSKRKNVPIIFGCDDNYSLYLGVAIYSLIVNSSEEFNYDIWILDGGISAVNKKLLLGLKNRSDNVSIRFFDILPYIASYKDELYTVEGAHYDEAMYYRLFIPSVFYQYADKVIYLDCDLIINADISKLLEIDLEKKDVGAAKEPGDPSWIAYRRKIKGKDWKNYFNSGVLVLNLKKLARSSFLKKCLSYLSAHRDLRYPDQDTLNAICSVRLIDKTWNSFPKKHKRTDIDKMSVVHYVGVKKPWQRNSSDFDEAWWGYAMETSLYDRIVKKTMSFEKNSLMGGKSEK